MLALPVTWKSMNSSALIQPLIASIAALSVGVPARDMERTTLYIGSSSLKSLDAYALVDYVTVMENGDMIFSMKNGQKI